MKSRPEFGEDSILPCQCQAGEIEGKRYLVCRNEAQAEKERGDREAIVAALDCAIEKGDKALIGNSAYRRYLRKTKEAKGKPAFEIDAGKLAEEARFDGIFVLRTNAKITPLQAVLRYRDLAAGREPVLSNQGDDAHAADLPFLGRGDPRPRVLLVPGAGDAEASRRSHVEAGVAPEWRVLLRDLDRLSQVRIRHRGVDWLVRSDAAPAVTMLFKRAQLALPPRARQARPPPPAQPKPARQPRGRPRRSATPT